MLVEQLPDAIRLELEDERFLTRKHYARSTYASGCHGPLCQKAERDRGRLRNERKCKEQEREYIPSFNARMSDLEEAKLEVILEWYLEEIYGQDQVAIPA